MDHLWNIFNQWRNRSWWKWNESLCFKMNCTAYCCVQLNYKYERHPTCMPYLNKRLHIMTNMSIEKSYIGDTRSNTKTTDKQNRQPGPQDVKSCESAFPFSKALLWILFCHRPLETFSALWCPKPRFGRWRPLRNCVFEVELISF